MPPVLDPSNSKVDGLAFLGLSLTRYSAVGHPDSITHQEAFDLNDVQDRKYEFILSTNDDGWLVGGGEPGPPRSYKLSAKDTAHVEIMRIGTYRPEWGGVAQQDIIDVMESGKILIPQIEALPTAVVANPDKPPELEIRFDMEPPVPNLDDPSAPLPINWQLRFLHNQLFRHFQFPSRFCPGPFHSTILRKAEFRSPEHRVQYFEKCEAAIQNWRQAGPQALNTGWAVDGTRLDDPPEYSSGIFLFLDRQNITHSFLPNFLPPYDTPEKRQIILNVLKQEWDEKTLSWKSLLTTTPQDEMELSPASQTTIAQDKIHTEEQQEEEISATVQQEQEETDEGAVNEDIYPTKDLNVEQENELQKKEQVSHIQVKDVDLAKDNIDSVLTEVLTEETEHYDVFMAPTDEWDVTRDDVTLSRNTHLLSNEEVECVTEDDESQFHISTPNEEDLAVSYDPEDEETMEIESHLETVPEVHKETQVVLECQSVTGTILAVQEESQAKESPVADASGEAKEATTNLDDKDVKADGTHSNTLDEESTSENKETPAQHGEEKEPIEPIAEEGTIINQEDAEVPVVGCRATEEPATEEPTTEEPATEEPATEEPATEEPATEEPVANERESLKESDTAMAEVKSTKHVEEKKDDGIIEESEGGKESVAASFDSGMFQSACCGLGMSLGY